ncbi:MAG TPA: serine/threonine-protein kinase [Gemmatimonadales bacterium]|jgi:serine/threonine-protein kinase
MTSTHGYDDALLSLQAELAGTYSIERELGRGGMGTVHLARDVSLDRLVAIKVLHAELAERPEHRERFLREARTAAQLVHPNIVPIYAVGETASAVYFVMGLIDGESLGARLHRDGPLTAADATRVIREVGQALALAHAHGFVHRDVTLDNIIVERSTGRAVLLDFGIAAEIEADGPTRLIGTPAYLAPELIQGDAPSPQSDIYALGIASWAMLTGRLPFPDNDTSRVLIQHISTAVPSLTQAAAATPGKLRRAIERALEKEPANRPRDVESWLQELAGGDGPPALATPLQHWLQRGGGTRVIYGLGMSVAAMAGVVSRNGAWWGGGWWGAILNLSEWFALSLPVLLVAHLAYESKLLRGLAREGYRIDDLRLALARARSERRRDRTTTLPLLVRVVRGATLTSFLLWFIVEGITGPSLAHTRFIWFYYEGRFLQNMMSLVTRTSYLMFWSGMAFCTISPALRAAPDGWLAKAGQRFWNSRVGAFCLKAAGVALRRDVPTPHTLHRPTELVLDLAIDDLWHGLPATTRRELKQLPAVAESLRERVAEMKELARQLERPELVQLPEAIALRQQLAERQESGIAALERLRLRLATLAGESGPSSALTEQLQDAEALQADLLTEMGAHPSLRQLLRLGSRQSGPTPSPAAS